MKTKRPVRKDFRTVINLLEQLAPHLNAGPRQVVEGAISDLKLEMDYQYPHSRKPVDLTPTNRLKTLG